MKIVLRLIATVALAATALIAAPAVQAAPQPAQALVGTWVGTYTGYVDGRYVSGGEKITITKAKGLFAKGTWQYKGSSGKWSSPKPVQFIVRVLPSGEVTLNGADGEGFYQDGNMPTPDSLEISYVDAQPELTTLHFSLKRR